MSSYCNQDDIALMSSEKENGSMESSCILLQSKVSDTHARVDQLKEQIHVLRQDGKNMRRNHDTFSKERAAHELSKVKKIKSN